MQDFLLYIFLWFTIFEPYEYITKQNHFSFVVSYYPNNPHFQKQTFFQIMQILKDHP